MRSRYIAAMSGPENKDSRAARLAEALRENLRRRKTQARARKEAAHEATRADAADPGPGGREYGRDEDPRD